MIRFASRRLAQVFVPQHDLLLELVDPDTRGGNRHMGSVSICSITLGWTTPPPPSVSHTNQNFNPTTFQACWCIRQMILQLRYSLCRCVIHLGPWQLTPAWWHMTASAWVSTDWLISPLAVPLRGNGNEWHRMQNVSLGLHATLAATSGGLGGSTTPLPLHAHAPQDPARQLHYLEHDHTCPCIYMNTLR